MAEFRYGPVELYLVGFEGESPDPAFISALTDQVAGGTLRILDFVIVSRSEDGDLTIVEVGEDVGLDQLEMAAIGIASEEDIAELAVLVPPGSSAAVVALELAFVRDLASKLAATGGAVLSVERIPAPVVNALVEAIEELEDEIIEEELEEGE